MAKEIKIVRESMNTDRDHALGLVFKLGDVFPIGQPHLLVFFDNEITRSQDWAIYGVNYSRPDLFRCLKFEGLQEARHFELGQKFHIEFIQMSLEEIDYRRTGKRFEPAYQFRVHALNTHR